jgi:hypothetical protein
MSRGLRLRPGSGPKLLGAVVGVVLVLALVVTGRVLSGSGLRSSVQPTGTTAAFRPYRVGERFACPSPTRSSPPPTVVATRSAIPPRRPGTRLRSPATTRSRPQLRPATPRHPCRPGRWSWTGCTWSPYPTGFDVPASRPLGGLASRCPARRCGRSPREVRSRRLCASNRHPAAIPRSGSCSRTAALWCRRVSSATGGRLADVSSSPRPGGRRRPPWPVLGSGRWPGRAYAGNAAASSSARPTPAPTATGCWCAGRSGAPSWP